MLVHVLLFGRIAFLLTRLPFGSTPAADCFNTISETVTDLAQEIATDETWNPNSLHSNLSEKIPSPSIPNKVQPLQQPPFPLTVPITISSIYHDVYIDDIITIALADNRSATEKARHAAPLAIHAIFRPKEMNEYVTRDHVLCLRKLEGEGQLNEIKATLGWIINTRLFKIFLHSDKFQLWTSDINKYSNPKQK